jgi:hypothetical protein
MAEHGIESKVTNRSNWNRPTYQRFSYTQRSANRDSWPQVWILRADDYTRARELLRQLGIEPLIRHSEELAADRNPTPYDQRAKTVARVRRIALLAIAGVFVVLALRYLHLI